jgi:hypothetical protein
MLAAMRRASSRVNSRCANGCEDVRFPRKHKTPMPNQQHPPGIAILRDATGRLALFINGQRVNVWRGQAQLVLLACLLTNLGSAVPYKGLFTVIGRKSDNWSTRHLLRQYMSMLRELLLANKAPVVIATVHDIGYAICKIVENPRGSFTGCLRPQEAAGRLCCARHCSFGQFQPGFRQLPSAPGPLAFDGD